MRVIIMNEKQFKEFYEDMKARCSDIARGYSKYDSCLKDMLMKTAILTAMSGCDGRAFTAKQIEKLNALTTDLLHIERREKK